MGESIEKLVSGYIEELAGRSGKGGKPVTFSIRLSERDHSRLLWLAEQLHVPKTPIAEKLLIAALEEAIQQYAEWASPEDPEKFLEEARPSMERPRPDHAGPEGAGPAGRKPRKPGPKRPR
ncbi:MAG TPA: hypothetical protein VHM16_06780 [Rubrobacteraceae bacterium]|nr:hypothetical protein [Rubrobacteraceae bacterium]